MAENDPEEKPEKPEPGAPRWAYGLAVIVSAVTVTWGIVRFFIEKSPESPHTSAAPVVGAARSVSATVYQSVSAGPGSVTVGTINNGATFNFNASASSQSATASASSKH